MVSILILSGKQAGLALSGVYAASRRAIERHTALRVTPFDALVLAERQAALRTCAGQASCFVRKVHDLAGADYLLAVSIDRLEGGLLLGLRLVEVRTEREVGAYGDEIAAGGSLLDVMERALSEVFPASIWGHVGGVVVRTEPSNAEVYVGGRSCVSPCTLERLAPGPYPVAVRKSGFEPWQGSVAVTPGQAVFLRAKLVESSGGFLSNPWLWTGVVAVAVAATVTSVVALGAGGDPLTVCIAPRRAGCDM